MNPANWGHDWHTFAPMGFSGIGAGAAYIFFAYIGFDAVSTTAQEAKNPQRDLADRNHRVAAVSARFFTFWWPQFSPGMVPWKEINIEAPLAVAFLDRGLTKASYLITAGALAGLTSVMLVMLLGQTRVLYSMANDGLLAAQILRCDSSEVPHAIQEHDSRGPARRNRRQHHVPIDDIGKMVNIGTLFAFVIVCIAVMVLRKTNPGPAAAVPHALGSPRSRSRNPLQRLHDVQARLDQLGAADHLARHWPGDLFHVQPPSQPRAEKRPICDLVEFSISKALRRLLRERRHFS